VIEKSLSPVNQYFLAYADEPLCRKHPLRYSQCKMDLQAFYNRLLPGISLCLVDHHNYSGQPLCVKHPLAYSHKNINRQTRIHEPLHGCLDCMKSQQYFNMKIHS